MCPSLGKNSRLFNIVCLIKQVRVLRFGFGFYHWPIALICDVYIERAKFGGAATAVEKYFLSKINKCSKE